MSSSNQQGGDRLKKRREEISLHQAAWSLLAPLCSLAVGGRGRLGLRVEGLPWARGRCVQDDPVGLAVGSVPGTGGRIGSLVSTGAMEAAPT